MARSASAVGHCSSSDSPRTRLVTLSSQFQRPGVARSAMESHSAAASAGSDSRSAASSSSASMSASGRRGPRGGAPAARRAVSAVNAPPGPGRRSSAAAAWPAPAWPPRGPAGRRRRRSTPARPAAGRAPPASVPRNSAIVATRHRPADGQHRQRRRHQRVAEPLDDPALDVGVAARAGPRYVQVGVLVGPRPYRARSNGLTRSGSRPGRDGRVDGGRLADHRARPGPGASGAAATPPGTWPRLVDGEAGDVAHREVVPLGQRPAAGEQHPDRRRLVVDALEDVEVLLDRGRGRVARVGLGQFLAGVEDQQHVGERARSARRSRRSRPAPRVPQRRSVLLADAAERLVHAGGSWRGTGTAPGRPPGARRCAARARRPARAGAARAGAPGSRGSCGRSPTRAIGIGGSVPLGGVPAGGQVPDQHRLADTADAAQVQRPPRGVAGCSRPVDRPGQLRTVKVALERAVVLPAARAEAEQPAGPVSGQLHRRRPAARPAPRRRRRAAGRRRGPGVDGLRAPGRRAPGPGRAARISSAQ